MKAIATEATERSIPAEDALRLVIDTTPALIHTGRPDGYLDYFNQRWLEFLGLPLEEVCGWRWTGAVHPEDVAGLLQKWHAALGSGEPLEAEARVRRAVNRGWPISVEVKPVSEGVDVISGGTHAESPPSDR